MRLRQRRCESSAIFGRVLEDTGKPPGFSVQVLKQVFAPMGQDASFEGFPANRAWRMIRNGERDGMFNATRTSEREGICSFPDEPPSRDRFVLFVRTADVGKLKFSLFDDLIGHDVAVREQIPGLFEARSDRVARIVEIFTRASQHGRNDQRQ